MGDFKGKITWRGECKTGKKKDGSDWYSQAIRIEELEGTYPQSIVATLTKKEHIDRVTKDGIVNVSYNFRTSEYQGKWFCNLEVWKAFFENGSGAPQQTNTQAPPAPQQTYASAPPTNDPLPF